MLEYSVDPFLLNNRALVRFSIQLNDSFMILIRNIQKMNPDTPNVLDAREFFTGLNNYVQSQMVVHTTIETERPTPEIEIPPTHTPTMEAATWFFSRVTSKFLDGSIKKFANDHYYNEVNNKGLKYLLENTFEHKYLPDSSPTQACIGSVSLLDKLNNEELTAIKNYCKDNNVRW